MKRRPEILALSVTLLVLVAFPASIFGYQAWRTASAGVRIVDIVARAPEQGGFAPDRLEMEVGETVRLRLSSPDVVHGFTIPGLGVNVDEIYPGKVVEVDVTPDKPGRYAFACTRWCGVEHWRMRGVIEAEGTGAAPAPTEPAPLYQRLGIDLDAMPPAPAGLPATRPSASAGATLGVALPDSLADPASRRTVAPAAAFPMLREDLAYDALSDDDVWSLVAWAWLKDVKPEALTRAETLYARDCAACHGPDGKGGGPAGVNLPGMAKMDPTMPKGPRDFTDAGTMLAASDVLLQGKLLRGGMGTGMPEFGSLYSDEEQWAMIAYLRTFLFAK
jgi:mono/diheme cytochrome c family protein/plastocyanin